MHTMSPVQVLLCSFVLMVGLTAAEPDKPADATSPGIFGEFTLASGEQVIGLYHPEQGTLEVYGPAKVRAVKPGDIVIRRRLSPEPEAEPLNLDAGRARVSTLGSLISDAQADVKRIENRRSELQKEAQSKRLERSKREEGNKDAQEAMSAEKDPERKATFAALSTEHLKAIAAANAAIADTEAAIAVIEARFKAAVEHCADLQARMNWLLGRLAPLVREAEEKKAKR